MKENKWKNISSIQDLIEKFSFSPNLLCLSDSNGKILYANQAWEICLGLPIDSIIEKELFSFVHINDISKTRDTLEDAKSKKIESFENRFMHKNGAIRYLRWTSIPEGAEGIIIAIAVDITQEKSIQHQMDNFYSALTDTAIVSVTDPSGKIIEVNDTFCEISGYRRDELIGQNHRILNSNFHGPKFFRQLWSTILDKKTWRGEVCNMRKDGSLYWVDSFVIALTDVDGKIIKFMSIRYDITDKKAAEESMIHTARLVTLGEMSANLAHEIKNPLSIIKLAAEDLKESLENDETSKEDLSRMSKIIDTATSRIVKIIQGLQAYSRQSELDIMEVMSTDQIIEETMVFSDYKIKMNNVNFNLETLPDVYIKAHPSQISQVLVNLIHNAIDACQDSLEKCVILSLQQEQGRIVFSVTDTGPRIPDDIAKHLMEPFFTTKPSGKGTGLGLSLSKKLAADHGGKLFYDPNYHQTRFVLELPIVECPKINKAS